MPEVGRLLTLWDLSSLVHFKFRLMAMLLQNVQMNVEGKGV